MAGVNDLIRRTEADILKVQTKIKAYQEKLSQLTEKRKQLQERALLEKISEIAPNYNEAQSLLDLLASENPQIIRNRGTSDESNSEPPRD